jgi:hypothetical protein
MTTPASIYQAIINERYQQDRKWGIQNHLDTTWASILVEEVGEVCKSINDTGYADTNELIQVAAVVVSWLENKKRNADEKVPGESTALFGGATEITP